MSPDLPVPSRSCTRRARSDPAGLSGSPRKMRLKWGRRLGGGRVFVFLWPGCQRQPGRSGSVIPAVTGSCGLKTSFDYLVRTTQPGMPASAQEIGNVDLAHCMPTIQDFAKTAGTASGECTQIALASDNLGYDVNASPAPTLRKVITDTGPGC